MLNDCLLEKARSNGKACNLVDVPGTSYPDFISILSEVSTYGATNLIAVCSMSAAMRKNLMIIHTCICVDCNQHLNVNCHSYKMEV